MAKVESRVQNLETRLQLLSKLNILYNAKAYRKLYILRSKRMFPLDSGFWILISKLSILDSAILQSQNLLPAWFLVYLCISIAILATVAVTIAVSVPIAIAIT